MKRLDLVGRRFGSLVVLSYADSRGNSRWLCWCDCGCEKVVKSNHLTMGKTKSCGCMKSALLRQHFTTHGHARTPEYGTWARMIQRCTNSASQDYQLYGGRGISVCDRWRSFENFLADMGYRPSGRYSIDRINNDGNYEPSNCRWATPKQQANNRRPARVGLSNQLEAR